jgi:hypothetical protein
LGNRDGKKVGVLGHCPTDRDTASAHADAGELRMRGPTVGYCGLSARNEIVDCVLLGRTLSGEMPRFTEFSAAARVYEYDDDSEF